MFEQRLDKLTSAVEVLLNFQKYNGHAFINHNQQCARPTSFEQPNHRYSSVRDFYPPRQMQSNASQSNRFPARARTRLNSENLCFFHSRFKARTMRCQLPYSCN